MRFDVAVAALDPTLRVIAPMRVGMGMTRDEELAYARERGIDVPSGPSSPFSIDANLWGRSIEAGVLEDPWIAPPADAFEWTVDPADAPRDGARRRHRLRGGRADLPRRRARSTASRSSSG